MSAAISPEFGTGAAVDNDLTLVKLRRFATRRCCKHFTDSVAIQTVVLNFTNQAENIIKWGAGMKTGQKIDSLSRAFVDSVKLAKMKPANDIEDMRSDLKRVFQSRPRSPRPPAPSLIDDVVVMGNPHPHNTLAGKAFVRELGQDLKRYWTAQDGPDHLGDVFYRTTDAEFAGVQALIDESNMRGGIQYDVVELARIQNHNMLRRLDAFKMLHPTDEVLLSFHSTGDASNFDITKEGDVLTHALPVEGTPVFDMATNGVSPHCLKRVAQIFGPGFYVSQRSAFVLNSQYRTSCKTDPAVCRIFIVLGLPGSMKDVTIIDKSKASDKETSFRVTDYSDSYNDNVFMYCTQFVSIQTYMAYVVDIIPKGHAIVPMQDPVVVDGE